MSQPKRYSPALEPGRGSNFNGFEVSMREDLAGKWVSLSDYAALAAENERLKAKLSMSEAIAEICSQPPGEGAITVKASLSTGKTVLPDLFLNHPRTEGGPK